MHLAASKIAFNAFVITVAVSTLWVVNWTILGMWRPLKQRQNTENAHWEWNCLRDWCMQMYWVPYHTS